MFVRNMNPQILLIGKLAYNLGFKVEADLLQLIKDTTIQESLHARDMHRSFVGMVSNVAYGLIRLNISPTIFSLVGKDFNWLYRPYLENLGVNLKLIVDEDKETALNITIWDEKDRKITIIQDNCYRFFAEKDIIDEITLEEIQNFNAAFIATGIIEADIKFLSDLNDWNKTIPLIYSPDGNINSINKWRLSQILEKITLLVCSDSELKIIEERLNSSSTEILKNSTRLRYIVSLVDRNKIIIYSNDYQMKVSEAPAEKILSPHDWSDAFRAGLIYGVSLKKPITEVVKLASALASYAVEYRENQTYSPSLEQISLRSFEVKTIRKDY